MQQAIELAKSAGYEYNDGDFTLAWDSILLDPKFFQALGKAMGWEDYEYWENAEKKVQKMWLEKQHDFIDHLAEGKDAESFFNELLK